MDIVEACIIVFMFRNLVLKLDEAMLEICWQIPAQMGTIDKNPNMEYGSMNYSGLKLTQVGTRLSNGKPKHVSPEHEVEAMPVTWKGPSWNPNQNARDLMDRLHLLFGEESFSIGDVFEFKYLKGVFSFKSILK